MFKLYALTYSFFKRFDKIPESFPGKRPSSNKFNKTKAFFKNLLSLKKNFSQVGLSNLCNCPGIL